MQGKFLISTDTICDGEIPSLNNEDGSPVLFDSKEEVYKELFEDAIAAMRAMEPDPDVDKDVLITKMEDLLTRNDVKEMESFLAENPEANYFGESVVAADEFIMNRKAIFDGEKVNIQGTKLQP
jgi:hypothetical protein